LPGGDRHRVLHYSAGDFYGHACGLPPTVPAKTGTDHLSNRGAPVIPVMGVEGLSERNTLTFPSGFVTKEVRDCQLSNAHSGRGQLSWKVFSHEVTDLNVDAGRVFCADAVGGGGSDGRGKREGRCRLMYPARGQHPRCRTYEPSGMSEEARHGRAVPLPQYGIWGCAPASGRKRLKQH